jgi:purine-nucleoside phosphorylase
MEEGKRLGIAMHEGVYAALEGPSYETPAEIHYLRTIGADLVGMSTVPEVIAARHMRMKVLGISCVTNMAAGILDQPINHIEVLETGERVKGQFVALLRAVIPRMVKETG